MGKLGSLSDDMKRQYEWQCRNCNHVFKNQGAGMKCTICGSSLQKIQNPLLEKELWEMNVGD